MDVPGYSELLRQAKAAQDSGDLKTAYYEYSKALNLLSRTLGTKIKFKGPDAIEAIPEGFALLLQQAREILDRLDKIALHAKRTPSESSPASLSTLSLKLARPSLTSKPSSSPSVRSTSYLLQRDKTKKSIPLIPISPLTKLALEHNYNLNQVSQRLEQTKQEGARSPSLSGSRDLAQLRRLIEDVRIQRAKVDAVSVQIQSATCKILVDWDADAIARQLTIIDTTLFKKVAIPKDLVRHDRKHWPAQACIDFETYVAHSMAHVILQAWDASRHPQPHSSNDSGSSSHAKSSNDQPIHNVIAHLIRISHILLHVYRNFNSFMAIMRALTSPEIKRAHSVWSGVPSKTKDLFRRLVTIADDHNHAQQYRETLHIKLEAFQNVGRDALVAIPWMRYHQEEVKSILHSYMTGHENRNGSTDVVLSAPGARKLSAVAALLTQCRSNEANQDDLLHPLAGIDYKASKSSSSSSNGSKDAQQTLSKNREPVSVDGLRHALTPVVDLASLGHGDPTVHHWLLTRPYLDKQQLIDESLEIEPLTSGEELPCIDRPLEDEDDDDSSVGDDSDVGGQAEDESFEHVAVHDLTSEQPASLAQKRPTPTDNHSSVSDAELDAIMDELLGDNDLDASDDDELFNDDNLSVAKREQETELPTIDKNQSELSTDVLQFLGINPDELDQSSSEDEDGGFTALAAALPKDKGKGRAQSQEQANDDELFKRLHDLTQQSRTLVQESHDFQRGLEGDFFKDKDNTGSQEEGHLSSNQSSPWPVKKFEPMTQGTEHDQLNINDAGVQGKELKDMTGEQVIVSSPALSGLESPQVEPAFSSLDVLRRQLDQMHTASETAMVCLDQDAPNEEIGIQKDKTVDKTDDQSSPFDAHNDPTESTFPSRFVSSSNPFAQYTKPTTSDESARPEPVRTLRTKRSRVMLKIGDHAEGTDQHAGTLGTSPPVVAMAASDLRHLSPPSTDHLAATKETKAFSSSRLSDSIANPLLASEEERQAIQERARLSLASHTDLCQEATTVEKQLDSSTEDDPVDYDKAERRKADSDTPESTDSQAGGDALNEVPVKTVADAPEVKVASDARVDVDDKIGDSPRDQSERVAEDSAMANLDDPNSPPSPATSPEGARSPSRGRQRRRIAGGMVPLPTPSKTLMSLTTTSNPSSSSNVVGSTDTTHGGVTEAVEIGDHLIVDEQKTKHGIGQPEKRKGHEVEDEEDRDVKGLTGEEGEGEQFFVDRTVVNEGGNGENKKLATSKMAGTSEAAEDEAKAVAAAETTAAFSPLSLSSSPLTTDEDLTRESKREVETGEKAGLLIRLLEDSQDEAFAHSQDKIKHVVDEHTGSTAVSGAKHEEE